MKTLLIAALLLFGLYASDLRAQSPDTPEALVSEVTVVRKKDKKAVVENANEKRVLLEATESVTLRVRAKKKSGKVKFLAPNGGTFNRRRGPLSVDAAKLDGSTEIEFTAGGTRGRYTVEMSSGAETEILEFWVGEESPLGRPGPDLTFNAPQ